MFNTPNDQSRPGYLKMGWHTIGHAPARVRPLSIRGAITLARNRVAASHWSEPCDFGVPVEDILADAALDDLLRASRSPDRLTTTRRTAAYVRWRYATPPLEYRAIVARGGLREGSVIVRVRPARRCSRSRRRRFPRAGTSRARRLIRETRHAVATHADYLIGVGDVPGGIPAPLSGSGGDDA